MINEMNLQAVETAGAAAKVSKGIFEAGGLLGGNRKYVAAAVAVIILGGVAYYVYKKHNGETEIEEAEDQEAAIAEKEEADKAEAEKAEISSVAKDLKEATDSLKTALEVSTKLQAEQRLVLKDIIEYENEAKNTAVKERSQLFELSTALKRSAGKLSDAETTSSSAAWAKVAELEVQVAQNEELINELKKASFIPSKPSIKAPAKNQGKSKPAVKAEQKPAVKAEQKPVAPATETK